MVFGRTVQRTKLFELSSSAGTRAILRVELPLNQPIYLILLTGPGFMQHKLIIARARDSNSNPFGLDWHFGHQTTFPIVSTTYYRDTALAYEYVKIELRLSTKFCMSVVFRPV